MDIPIDHDDRVYLIERHLESHRELQALATEYAQRSEAFERPAILTTLQNVDEVVAAIA